jgi:hypothetical protein
VEVKPNGATLKLLLSKKEKEKVSVGAEIPIKKTKKEYKDDVL